MRVLITTDWYEPVINGVVTSVMNLSRQLRERGHEVKILTLSRTFHSYFYVYSIRGDHCCYINGDQKLSTDPQNRTFGSRIP